MYSTYRYVSRPGNAEDAAAGIDSWAGLTETFFYSATELAAILAFFAGTGAALGSGIRIIEMKLWNFSVYTRFTFDGTTWGDDMELDPDMPPTQVPFSPLGFMIQNVVAGDVGRYEFDAYW